MSDRVLRFVLPAVALALGVLLWDLVVRVNALPPHILPEKDVGGIHIPGSTLGEIERYAILKALEATGGSTSRAAEMLGISVRKIQYKLHEYQSAPKSATEVLRDAHQDSEPG